VPWLLVVALLALVVLGSVGVLALALLSTWRTVKALTSDLGRAAEVTADPALQEQLAQLSSRAPGPAPAPAALSADGAALAARVRGHR
jgi:Tfp pilus assembly protein PilX